MTMTSLMHGVFEWYVRFRDDYKNHEDDESRGRPTAVRTPDMIEAAREWISTDRWMALRMLEEKLQINRETIHKFLVEDLR
jgi:hypothetical protein